MQVQVQQVQQRRVQSAECRVQQRSGTVGSGHWDESAVECSAAGALARQGRGRGGGGGSRSRFRRTLFSLRVLCIKLYFVRAADREEPHQRWTRGGKMPGWSLD